jgi:transcriptional regulator with XRE-family HTH domain
MARRISQFDEVDKMSRQNASRTSKQSALASLREKRGLTQLQLAVLIGVTPNTIQGWEKHGLPNLKKYRRLASALGCDLSELDEADDQGLFTPEDIELMLRGNEESTNEKVSGKESQNISSEPFLPDRPNRRRR